MGSCNSNTCHQQREKMRGVLKRVATYLRDEAEDSEPMRDPVTHMELSVAIKDAAREP